MSVSLPLLLLFIKFIINLQEFWKYFDTGQVLACWIGAELLNFWPILRFLVILWPLTVLYVTVLTFFELTFTDWLQRNQHFGVQWHKDEGNVLTSRNPPVRVQKDWPLQRYGSRT